MSTLKVNALQDTSGNGFYPARVWCAWETNGTYSILRDGDVSSVTDEGTGKSRVDYAVTFSSSHYAASGSGAKDDGNDDGNMGVQIGGYSGSSSNPNATNHCHVRTRFPTGSNLKDTGYNSLMVIG